MSINKQLILLLLILMVPLVSSVTINEGVIMVTNNVTWNFTTSITLDELTIRNNYVVFDNDNLSIRPTNNSNISIYKSTGAGETNNNFSITGEGIVNWDVNLENNDKGLIVIKPNYYFPGEPFNLFGTLNFYYYSISKNMTINIFDSENQTLITQNVSVDIFNNDNSFSTWTTSGVVQFPILIPNNYEVRLRTNNYADTSSFYYLTNISHQNKSVYMTRNNSIEFQVVQVVDTTNQKITGSVVRMQEEIVGVPNNWLSVNEQTTNANGKVYFPVVKDAQRYYRFSVITDGEPQIIDSTSTFFTSKTNFISGLEETVTIVINTAGLGDFDFLEELYDVVYNGGINNNTAFFEYIDGGNSLESVTMIISGKYLGNSTAYEHLNTQTVTSNSGNLTYDFIPINNTVYRVEAYLNFNGYSKLAYEDYKLYDVDVVPNKNVGLLIAVALLIVVAFLTRFLGVLVSSISAFLMILVTNVFHLTDIPITVITSLVALAVIFFFRPREGGQ